jgi:hypothetical protein
MSSSTEQPAISCDAQNAFHCTTHSSELTTMHTQSPQSPPAAAAAAAAAALFMLSICIIST